jgi:hypothetical protein
MTCDTKYLSIFASRMIPDSLKQTYPLYYKFVEYFLQYLEQPHGVFQNIANFSDFIDIDKIAILKNGTTEEQELADKLIYQLYEQMIGSKEARYLSELLDEILFLKKQKSIFKYTIHDRKDLLKIISYLYKDCRDCALLRKLEKSKEVESYISCYYDRYPNRY